MLMYVCMYVCMCAHYNCMYVCMLTTTVCMYVCPLQLYVCMYVHYNVADSEVQCEFWIYFYFALLCTHTCACM